MDLDNYIASEYGVSGKPPLYLPINRWEGLAELFRAAGFTVGAEIGVEKGLYSQRLCERIPGLRLYCIDAWLHYPGYRVTVSQSRFDSMYAETVERMKPYDAHIMRSFSRDAAQFFRDGSLDFVFIDAAHDFYNVTQDIYYWERKVRQGGIVAGHDFKRDKGRDWECHVKDVVQAWAYSHAINPWYVTQGDNSPVWFWVKK